MPMPAISDRASRCELPRGDDRAVGVGAELGDRRCIGWPKVQRSSGSASRVIDPQPLGQLDHAEAVGHGAERAGWRAR